eukprot:Hpha_TRINITY_DN15810_c0_g2::TRINITY_DN15810_c0_g2_i1::g.191285::m.191285
MADKQQVAISHTTSRGEAAEEAGLPFGMLPSPVDDDEQPRRFPKTRAGANIMVAAPENIAPKSVKQEWVEVTSPQAGTRSLNLDGGPPRSDKGSPGARPQVNRSLDSVEMSPSPPSPAVIADSPVVKASEVSRSPSPEVKAEEEHEAEAPAFKPITATKSSCRISQVLPLDPRTSTQSVKFAEQGEQEQTYKPITSAGGALSLRNISVHSGTLLQNGEFSQAWESPQRKAKESGEKGPKGPPEPLQPGEEAKKSDGPPWKIMLFTMNLLIGLAISQVIMDNKIYSKVVAISTMFCLSFIMIGVGYEFEIDKEKLRSYVKDMVVAMGAAAVPWLLGALWFMTALPDPLPFKEALAVAIFSAPTSAGILFSMLEAAGLKQTWLFQKARVLAIFDDLGTILLLIPIKVLIVGPQWELSIVMALIVLFLACGWWNLHQFIVPYTWNWTLLYAVIVTGACEFLHYITKDHIPMQAVHLEVLLPAFTFGVMILVDHHHEPHPQNEKVAPAPGPEDVEIAEVGPSDGGPSSSLSASSESEGEEGCAERLEERVGTIMSAVFMVFVGLSMPKLEIFGGSVGSGSDSGSEEKAAMGVGVLMFHVAMMTILMILGKMVPLFFYRNEASLKQRFALCVGMCPRGEVGAGVIVVALALGIKGDAITIAVMCLALNLILSGFFIMAVKRLARDEISSP